MKNYKIITISSIFLLLIIVAIPNVLSEENSKTIYVDDDGTADYISIQDAINASSNGDTIYVINGYYNESLSINKSISLIGENKETTTINAKSTGKDGITIRQTSNVTISGFTVSNGGNRYGVEFLWCEEIVISNCDILMNEVGMNIIGDNNTIINCSILNNSLGVFLLSGYNNTIRGCKILNNTDGMFLLGSRKNIIDRCNISYNIHKAILLEDSFNNTISSCNIINNDYGIDVSLSFPSYLLYLHPNETYTNLVISSTDNTIYHNNFINNSYQSFDTGNNTWDNGKEGNYWDDYNGTDKNNDGIGDIPYNISGEKCQDLYPLMSPYYGRIVVKDFYVDQDAVIYMLWIAMIATIIFLMPIAYIWYRKTRPRE